jgi:hypothetical protein
VPDCIVTATTDSLGNATATMPTVASGLEWVVQQIGLAVTPLPGVVLSNIITAVVKRDDKVIDTTNNGNGGSMGGQPYYRFTSSNTLTIIWANAGAGSQVVATISYTEHGAGQGTMMNTGVV